MRRFVFLTMLFLPALGSSVLFANAAGMSLKGETFCVRLDGLVTRYLSDKGAEFLRVQSKLSAQKKEGQNVLTAIGRTTNDARRAAKLNALAKNAKTDEEKKEAAEYRVAVEAAVARQRKAVDEANDTFRNSLDALRAEEEKLLSAAEDNYQAAVRAAGTKARQTCDAGARKSESEFRTDIHLAIRTRQKTINGIVVPRDRISKLTLEYRRSIRAANGQLRKDLAEAAKILTR